MYQFYAISLLCSNYALPFNAGNRVLLCMAVALVAAHEEVSAPSSRSMNLFSLFICSFIFILLIYLFNYFFIYYITCVLHTSSLVVPLLFSENCEFVRGRRSSQLSDEQGCRNLRA